MEKGLLNRRQWLQIAAGATAMTLIPHTVFAEAEPEAEVVEKLGPAAYLYQSMQRSLDTFGFCVIPDIYRLFTKIVTDQETTLTDNERTMAQLLTEPRLWGDKRETVLEDAHSWVDKMTIIHSPDDNFDIDAHRDFLHSFATQLPLLALAMPKITILKKNGGFSSQNYTLTTAMQEGRLKDAFVPTYHETVHQLEGMNVETINQIRPYTTPIELFEYIQTLNDSIFAFMNQWSQMDLDSALTIKKGGLLIDPGAFPLGADKSHEMLGFARVLGILNSLDPNDFYQFNINAYNAVKDLRLGVITDPEKKAYAQALAQCVGGELWHYFVGPFQEVSISGLLEETNNYIQTTRLQLFSAHHIGDVLPMGLLEKFNNPKEKELVEFSNSQELFEKYGAQLIHEGFMTESEESDSAYRVYLLGREEPKQGNEKSDTVVLYIDFAQPTTATTLPAHGLLVPVSIDTFDQKFRNRELVEQSIGVFGFRISENNTLLISAKDRQLQRGDQIFDVRLAAQKRVEAVNVRMVMRPLLELNLSDSRQFYWAEQVIGLHGSIADTVHLTAMNPASRIHAGPAICLQGENFEAAVTTFPIPDLPGNTSGYSALYFSADTEQVLFGHLRGTMLISEPKENDQIKTWISVESTLPQMRLSNVTINDGVIDGIFAYAITHSNTNVRIQCTARYSQDIPKIGEVTSGTIVIAKLGQRVVPYFNTGDCSIELTDIKIIPQTQQIAGYL